MTISATNFVVLLVDSQLPETGYKLNPLCELLDPMGGRKVVLIIKA